MNTTTEPAIRSLGLDASRDDVNLFLEEITHMGPVAANLQQCNILLSALLSPIMWNVHPSVLNELVEHAFMEEDVRTALRALRELYIDMYSDKCKCGLAMSSILAQEATPSAFAPALMSFAPLTAPNRWAATITIPDPDGGSWTKVTEIEEIDELADIIEAGPAWAPGYKATVELEYLLG